VVRGRHRPRARASAAPVHPPAAAARLRCGDASRFHTLYQRVVSM